MRDEAIRIARREPDDAARRNRLREYLQHAVLREMFEIGLLERLVFHGGTALRILHDLARFSEALDFHTLDVRTGDDAAGERGDFDLTAFVDELGRRLRRAGYALSLGTSPEDNVQSCRLGFEELLHDVGISARPGHKLTVKLEVDRNPPAGFATGQSLVDRYFPIALLHHDRPTFVAGKLHSLLQRPYPKGRDYYDLMFFLTRWADVEPNLPYLGAALAQTGYEGDTLTTTSWKSVVAERVEGANWPELQRDVEPFLLRPADRRTFDRELLLSLLRERD